jgi:hypothetical protein
MKTEDLKAKGLTEEQVAFVMAENGKDVNAVKSKLEAERDNYKEQLTTAKNALKEFEGVDVKELNGKIAQLTADLTRKDDEYRQKLADMEFDSVLNDAIRSSSARDAVSVRANLDLAALKASKNQTEDIKSAIEKVKTEKSFLFGSDEPILNPVAPQSGSGGKGLSGVEAAFLARNPGLKI